MGVAVDALEDEAPLLKAPAQQQASAQQECAVAQHPQPAGSWEGNLLQCCGRNCTGQGWLSCAFAYFAPCFAFGHNMRRAFSASLWLHTFIFFVLFYAVHRSFLVAVNLTADNCRADPPPSLTLQHPRPLHYPEPLIDANAHATWLSGRKLLQVDDVPNKFAQAFADVLPSAEAHAVVHGGSFDDIPQSQPQGNEVQAFTGSVRFDTTEALFEDAVPDHPAHPHPNPRPPHPAVIPFTGEFGKSTPGCQRAYMGLFALFHLTVAALLLGIIYAAHQRTLIRRKFLIPGSACGDLFAWLCCSPCALCQETRTLRANNVVNGQWPRMDKDSVDEEAAMKPPKVLEF